MASRRRRRNKAPKHHSDHKPPAVCFGARRKIRYTSKGAAWAHIGWMIRTGKVYEHPLGPDGLTVYWCGLCRSHHIGHNIRKRKEAG